MWELFGFTFVFSLLITTMAVQDLKTTSVSGELCLCASGIALLALWQLHSRHWLVIMMVIALLVLVIGNVGLPFIGEADLVPIAFAFVIYGSKDCPISWIFIYPLSLLFVLIPYAKVYANLSGEEWHFGCGKYVPALPAFALAWWLSLVCMTVLYIKGVY